MLHLCSFITEKLQSAHNITFLGQVKFLKVDKYDKLSQIISSELHRLVPHPEPRGAEDRAEDHRQQQVRLYDVRGQLESVQELRG